jgi:hypothetical protein
MMLAPTTLADCLAFSSSGQPLMVLACISKAFASRVAVCHKSIAALFLICILGPFFLVDRPELLRILAFPVNNNSDGITCFN